MNKTLIALALALATSGSALANTVELNVSATITPAACTLALGQNGTVTLPAYKAEALNATTATNIGSGSLGLSVTCPGAQKVALKVVDDQASSVATGVAAVAKSGATDAQAYGLGTTSKGNVGAYVVSLSAGTLGAANATFIRSTDAGVTWSATQQLVPGTGSLTTWASGTTVAPAQLRTGAATLTVDAAVVAANNIDLTSTVRLAGKATLELEYL